MLLLMLVRFVVAFSYLLGYGATFLTSSVWLLGKCGKNKRNLGLWPFDFGHLRPLKAKAPVRTYATQSFG